MLLPETLRHALFWVAVAAFVVAEGALLLRAFDARRLVGEVAVRGRLGRGLELVLLLVPGLLTAILFALAWHEV